MPDTVPPPFAPEELSLPPEEPPLDAEALLAMARDDRPRRPASGLRGIWERARPPIGVAVRWLLRQVLRPRDWIRAERAWWGRQPIRRKVWLAGVLLDLLVVALIALLFPLREWRDYRAERRQLPSQGVALAQVVAGALGPKLQAGDYAGLTPTLTASARHLPNVAQIAVYRSGQRLAFAGRDAGPVPASIASVAVPTMIVRGGSSFAAFPLALGRGSAAIVVEMSSAPMRRHLLLSTLFALVLCAIFSAATFVVSRVLARGVLSPFSALADTVGATTAGAGWDLTLRAQAHAADESAELAAGFNRFLAETGHLVGGVKQVTERVLEAAAGMKGTLQGLSHSASALEDTIAQIANTAEDQLARLRQNLALAAESMQLADRMRASAGSAGAAAAGVARSARAGHEVADRARSQMDHISERADETRAIMASLGERSGHIDRIVAAIGEIAEQTNLLALNAAIEAARAGENGRGFAVVADEVRKLADQAAAYASEIGDSIDAIRREIRSAVAAVANVDHEVLEGSGVIASSVETFRQMVEDIDGVAGEVALIADLAQQQRLALTRVNESAAAIAQMGEEQALSAAEMSATVQEQTASTNEASAAADGLNAVAFELQAQVDRIRI